MVERSPCGSGGCMTCPFAFSEEAEMAQNYGCLPNAYEIIKMKEDSGHNWVCHMDESKMCGGYTNWIKENRPDLDVKVGGLISYNTWFTEGTSSAMQQANERYGWCPMSNEK